ncbi:MAG: DUF2059 domain-containing protein [Terriglobia bacterium]
MRRSIDAIHARRIDKTNHRSGSQAYAQKELDDIVTGLTAVYDRYLTDDDVRQISAFYESPLGRKAAETPITIDRVELAWLQKHAAQLVSQAGAQL